MVPRNFQLCNYPEKILQGSLKVGTKTLAVGADQKICLWQQNWISN